MLDAYLAWVKATPLLSAAVQFGLLGTLGEVIATSARQRRFAIPCTVPQLVAKALAWALLGIVIKYGFAGMKGFTQALIDHHLLPSFVQTGVAWAFAVSVLTNLLFGPQMMAFHRVEDNLILGTRGFAGIDRAWKTLIWFWIPAHTVTFSLPVDFQIGLAAAWSVVLGLILGFSKPPAAVPAAAREARV